ncbi:cellulase family glycosylhydrolase [Gracilibacillus salinarum]|uniref:Cellulase family glycosylhydrolase n=1 Tax=Gracilibacillus salinarum TaxID=2932255 RepID=A0ABY4GQS2_9BACI|nr:cellulase family glycosylhydrolase [Gracilibacillus salinarum]UOQ86753.1 cellulase family glycosylhydrolase [Gracilibacillus salinarum]
MKNLFLKTAILTVLIWSVCTITAMAETHAAESIDMENYAENMQPGWNLGNSYDAVGSDETAWGNPLVSQALIEKIAAEGFKSIRIPITFDQRMDTDGDYQIDQDFLDRVDQTVQWALEEDLYVMINVHHDSWIWMEYGMQSNHDQTVARYEAIWTQLANHFKDYSTHLMFESINEPRFTGTATESQQYLDELNTTFHEIVRSSGGNNDVRPLVLPTINTGAEQEKLDALSGFIQQLEDPNIMATVHYYGFWPFSVNIAGYTRFEEDSKAEIQDVFDRVHNSFTANGIPVIIGEYGLLGFDQNTEVIQQGEKLKFFEYMLNYAQQKDFVHMLWDNGQHLGRESLAWSDPALFDMIQTSWTTRSAVPDDNFIYLNPEETVTDRTITFNLHGKQFEGIYLNDQLLQEGSDYQINNNSITFTSEFLSTYVSADSLGNAATISVTFNEGHNWDIEVRNYQKPELQSAEGTTASLKIPTSFNGDKLATMEAYYEDGSIAGPQNWTAYKEFEYTFSPDYDAGTITLKNNFFNELNDGITNLTFHFWSGETVEYTIEKNGEQVQSVQETVTDNTGAGTDDTEKETETPSDNSATEETTEENETTEEEQNDQQKQTTTSEMNNETTQTTTDLTDTDEDTNDQVTTDATNLEQNRLPDTATNQYNLMSLGLSLLLLGIITLAVQMRKKYNH